MGQGNCFDERYGNVPESRQTGGEGERDYFDHIKGYKVSSADNMLVIVAFAFLISLGLGIHLSRAPAPTEQSTSISTFLGHTIPAADACDEPSPYSGNSC
jgi:hypothetical protein